MERKRGKVDAVLPRAYLSSELALLLQGRTFWTNRGYDTVAGAYRYTLTIVLAEGEAAIND